MILNLNDLDIAIELTEIVAIRKLPNSLEIVFKGTSMKFNSDDLQNPNVNLQQLYQCIKSIWIQNITTLKSAPYEVEFIRGTPKRIQK